VLPDLGSYFGRIHLGSDAILCRRLIN